MILDKRQIDIIKLISENPFEYTYSKVSEVLNISERTVRRDFDGIYLFLEMYNIKIEKIDGKFKIPKIVLAELEKIEDNLEFSKYEGNVIYLSMLLESNTIKISDIASELFISSSKCLKDINEFESDFSLEGKLIKRRKIGISLEISEIEKRKLVFSVLMQYFLKQDLYEMIETRDMSRVIRNPLVRYIESMIDIAGFKEIFENTLTLMSNTLSHIIEEELLSVVLKIMIQRKSLTEGNILSDFEALEYKISANVAEIYKIDDKNEINYLIYQLYEYTSENSMNIDYENIRASLHENLASIDDKLNVNFLEYPDFFENVFRHILRTLTSEYKYSSNTELTSKFRNDYKELFNLIKSEMTCLNMNDNEIAYMMVYYISYYEEYFSEDRIKILTVCTGGMGSSKMLSSRIKNEFKNVDVNTTSIALLKAENIKSYNLILSTVDLSIDDSLYIKVNPLLDNDAILYIKDRLRSRKYEQLIKTKIEGDNRV